MSDVRCACQKDLATPFEDLLSAFATLRDRCPALRLLVPEEVWPSFAAWDAKGDHDAFHRSILLLALDRGHLSRVTAPIHRFLLDNKHPRGDLRKQYVQDLRERWMLPDDPFERHRLSRIFMGRIVELECAAWLEENGWRIVGLEATREGPDIEAIREGRLVAFEVKAIGSQKEAFASVLQSLRGQPAGRWTSPDAAANYVLFRSYECGKQLMSTQAGRVALLAIEELCWHDFQLQLEEGWINWKEPMFLGDDADWEDFIKVQEQRYPQLRGELAQVVSSLDAVWVLQTNSRFEYVRLATFGSGPGASF